MDEGNENFSEDAIVNAVNGVIEASAVDDDKVDDMTEAMIKVLSRQIQSNTAAKQYDVEPKVLEVLVGAAKRRLLQQMNNAGSSSNSKKAVKREVVTGRQLKKEPKGKPNQTHQRGLEMEQAEEEEEEPSQKNKNSAEDRVDETEEEGGVGVGTGSGKARGRPRKKTASSNVQNSLSSVNTPPANDGGPKQRQGTRKQPKRSVNEEELMSTSMAINTDNDIVSGSKVGQRGRKRMAKEVDNNDKNIAGNKQTQPTGKRTRRSAQLNSGSSSSAQSINNKQHEELVSLNMALTLYKGGNAVAAADSSLAVQPYSLAQQRPRRSTSSINVAAKSAAVVPLTWAGKRALTWSDKPPATAGVPEHLNPSQQQTPGNQNADLDETVQSLGSANKRLISKNPRWQQFPRVVEDVVDTVLARMHSRNEKEQEKCANMKAGVLDIIRLGSTVRQAHRQYGVGESTIRRYSHDVKVDLEKCLGSDVVSDEFLQNFDGEKTTYAQLCTALNRPATSANEQSSQSHPTRATSLRTRKSAANAANDSTPEMRTKRTPALKPPPSASGSVLNNNINKGASSSSAAQNADGLQQPNMDMMSQLSFLNDHNAPALLTSQRERTDFIGTKEEFCALVIKILKRFYNQSNQSGLQLGNLASLAANYAASEYMITRRMHRASVPPSMLRGTLMLLSRCVRMEQVRFTDVDAELDAEGV